MLIPVCCWIVMAVSLNLVVGISGELSLGHAGFMSVGAFTGAVVSGWLLNAFVGKERKQLPMLILSSVMFMLIHIPIWITQGILVSVFTSLGFIMIIVLGMIFGSVFLKSRNILIPIALHMYWDLLVELFS